MFFSWIVLCIALDIFSCVMKGLPPETLCFTAGSEISEDIEPLSHNPLHNQLEGYLPTSRPQAYSTPSSKASEMLGGLSGLSIGGVKPEMITSPGNYNGLIRPSDLNTVGNSSAPRTSMNDGSLSGYLPAYTAPPSAPAQQVSGKILYRVCFFCTLD